MAARRVVDRKCLSGCKSFGYWEEHPEWLHPRDFIDPNWDPGERDHVLAYLDACYQLPVFQWGYADCRLGCPRGPDTGSRDLTDGKWVFPEGLAHYIRVHGLKPPQAFLDTVRDRHFQVPELPELEL